MSGALSIISELNETRDKTLYQEVGRLTRSLHESIQNFHIDMQGNGSEEISRIEDASDRLAYVVDMTSKAANKTLDLVEGAMPIASNISSEAKELTSEWGRLQRKEMKPEEFRALTGRMDTFLNNLSGDSDKVYQHLSDILLAQDFQDLTGQVINKVTALVKDVETNLVNLVRMAGRSIRLLAPCMKKYKKKNQQLMVKVHRSMQNNGKTLLRVKMMWMTCFPSLAFRRGEA